MRVGMSSFLKTCSSDMEAHSCLELVLENYVDHISLLMAEYST